MYFGENYMKKLLVIDGNSILNRAYYGIRPLTNKNGLYTHAVYGMVNIISKHVESLKPDYCAVAFDLKAPTFRHKMYTENRDTKIKISKLGEKAGATGACMLSRSKLLGLL